MQAPNENAALAGKPDFAVLRSGLEIVFVYLAIAAFIARASNFYFSILVILTLVVLSLSFNYIGFITNWYSKLFQILTVISIVFILACDTISTEYHTFSRHTSAKKFQNLARGLGASAISTQPNGGGLDLGTGEILSIHRNYGKTDILRRARRI